MPVNISGELDENGREIINRRAGEFPAIICNDDLTFDPVPWHWHDELEINVVKKGKILFKAGKKEILLSEGEGYFVNGGVLHAGERGDGTETDPCLLRAVVFHPQLVGGTMDSVFWQKYLLPLLTSRTLQGMVLSPQVEWQREAIEASLQAWRAINEKPDGYEFTAREQLSRLVYLVTAHRPTAETASTEKVFRDNRRIKAMLQHIETHFGEEVSMGEIAASAGISESECLRCFRSVLNVTPIQYLKKYRIGRAAGLLTSTDARISDIAVRCGFQEMSYFAKVFKELYGKTPSAYRRELAGEQDCTEGKGE